MAAEEAMGEPAPPTEDAPPSPDAEGITATIDNEPAADEPIIAPEDGLQKLPHPYRGIRNTNGTACHTSSAVQLLFHCFPELREAMLELAPVSADAHVREISEKSNRSGGSGDTGDAIRKEFVHQLSWFFHLLAYGEDVLAMATEEAGVETITDGEAKAEEANEVDDEETKVEDGNLATVAVATTAATAATAVAAASAAGKVDEVDDESDTASQFKAFLADDAASHASASVAGREKSRKERRRKGGKKSRRRRERSDDGAVASAAAVGAGETGESSDKGAVASAAIGGAAVGAAAAAAAANAGDDDANGAKRATVSFDETDSAVGEGLKSPQSPKNETGPSSPSSLSRKSSHSQKSKSSRHSKSSRQSKSGRRKLKGKDDINALQRAAIEAFMRRARSGENDAEEWRRLVRVMGDDNREQYLGALGMVLQSHRGGSDPEASGEHSGNGEVGTPAPSNRTETGNLGGGRGGSAPEASSGAVDPTHFYSHLSSYTAALDLAAYINVDSVGDAAMAFRCLVSSLEFSVGREVERLDGVRALAEIDEWNEEGKEGKEEDEQALRQKRLKSSLDEVQRAMQQEWSGTLVSRIIGTFTTVESSATASFSFHEDEEKLVTKPRTVTTTTTIQRTKRNGNIERPIPVPFPLPVVQQSSVSLSVPHHHKSSGGRGGHKHVPTKSGGRRNYFPSLDQSLRSVTVEPNPIRGYDWRGLMKREGEAGVVEETFVSKVDQDGKEVVDPEEEKTGDEPIAEAVANALDDDKEATSREIAIGDGALDDEVKLAPTAAPDQDDDVSVLTSASRTIACQTDFGYDMGTQTTFDEIGNVVHEGNVKTIEVSGPRKEEEKKEEEEKAETKDEEETKEENAPASPRPAKFAIERDAAYKAAVAALTKTPKVQRSREELLGPSADNRRGEPGTSVSSRERVKDPSVESFRSQRGPSANNQRGRTKGASINSPGHTREASVDSRRSLPVESPRRARGTSVDSRGSRVSVDSRRSLPVESSWNWYRGMKLDNPTGQNRSSLERSSATSTPRDSAVADDGVRTKSYETSPSIWESLVGFTTPRGMVVGPSAQSTAQAQESVAVSYVPSPTGSPGSIALPLDSDDSDSQESSSVDSHVSSVHTDSTDAKTEETHSSAIETPSDIDDLSLGSFTDSSLSDADEKKEEDVLPQDKAVPKPDVEESEMQREAAETAAATSEEIKVVPKPTEVASSSDSDSSSSSSSDESSSSSSSSSTSSSASSSTSSTDSSSSSSSEESSNDGTSSTLSSADSLHKNQVAEDGKATHADESCGDDGSDKGGHSQGHHPPLQPHSYNREEWVTRKETRLCHPLPRSLVFHLKRFEYSPKLGRVEKLPGEMRVPEELDMKVICLEMGVAQKDDFPRDSCCYRYCLSGAIVHVDPIAQNEEEEAEYGEPSEGHYVTFVNSPAKDLEDEERAWTEIDDDAVRSVEEKASALKVISGCDASTNVKERRYATLVVYSRGCQCRANKIVDEDEEFDEFHRVLALPDTPDRK